MEVLERLGAPDYLRTILLNEPAVPLLQVLYMLQNTEEVLRMANLVRLSV